MNTPARLDPVGRLRLPGRPALLRGALAAVLLLTAAAVLYAGGGAPAGTAPRDPAEDPGPAPAPAATDPSAAPTVDQPTADQLATHPGRLAIPEGLVGVPVGLGDPARLAGLRPGDRVDLLAAPSAGTEPEPLASAALVLAVDQPAATLLLAATPDQARAVVAVPPSTPLAVIVRG